MTSRRSTQQIVLVLDTRLPWESLLVNRWQDLPPERRSEWLRGVLLQGFRAECQSLRQAHLQEAKVPLNDPRQTPFAQWLLARDRPGNTRASQATPRPPSKPQPPSNASRKPFAELQRVIG